MFQLRCPYCGGCDGRTTTTASFSTSPSSLVIKECKSCGRIVEEHLSDVQEIFVERAQDTPLCIVTPDLSNDAAFLTPPLEDDPFESIGFITAFSTWSLEFSPLFTSTTSSICGYLAELERMLLDPHGGCSPSVPSVNNNAEPVSVPVMAPNVSAASHGCNMVDNLRAYFHILEVSSLLGLDRDISDHALQMFRDCSAAAYLRNRNVEALATAALVQASREAKEARTLQEVSTAANISQKEIHRYMKILTDALKLSQPIDSNSISVYMPRFCSILELDKVTQDLATHIGEVVMNKSFCTRRNPISISAAAIYLSCQLEDKRKTQTEICKATALTEVTLRKVYKELIENINDLLPTQYTPVVPLDKAFSATGSSWTRTALNKINPSVASSSVHPVTEISVAKTIGSPILSRSRSGGSETILKAAVSHTSSENVLFVGPSSSLRFPAVSTSDVSDVFPCRTESLSVGQSVPTVKIERDAEQIMTRQSSDKNSSKLTRFNQNDFFDSFTPEANLNSRAPDTYHGTSTIEIRDTVNVSSSREAAQLVVPFSMGSATIPLPVVSSEMNKRDLSPIFDRKRLHVLEASCLDAQDGTISPTILDNAAGSTYVSGASINASSSLPKRSPKSMEGFSPEKRNSLQHWLMDCGVAFSSEKEKTISGPVYKSFGLGASTIGSNKSEPTQSLWKHHSVRRAPYECIESSGEENENFKSQIKKELSINKPLTVLKADSSIELSRQTSPETKNTAVIGDELSALPSNC